MRLSLTKAAHVAMSSVAWQEIRIRSGRDDKVVADEIPGFQERSAKLQIPRLPRISCRESCGFGELHVVLFRENHISGGW
jgi:hypothetical protein